MITIPVPIDEDREELLNNEDPTIYRSIVGSLLWASLCTRPDISYAVSKLGSKVSKPSKLGYSIMKKLLRYIKGTLS